MMFMQPCDTHRPFVATPSLCSVQTRQRYTVRAFPKLPRAQQQKLIGLEEDLRLHSLPRPEAEHEEVQPVPSTSYTPASLEEGGSLLSRTADGFQKLVKTIGKAAAIGGLCFALALSAVNPALAARSGGYMGGSNFGSRGSSMGGMGGSSLGGSMGGSIGRSNRIGGGMLGGGLMNSPSLRRGGPSVGIRSFGWGGPPVFYGGGYGYGYGAPVASSGGGLGGILILGILAAFLWTAFSSRDGSLAGDVAGERVTVAKLQVGLLGSARQMKRDLERIADRANTDSPSGLHYILQETVLALLRNPDYCIYGTATTKNQRGLEAGESSFNKLSMEERSKFKQETLVNVSGRRKSGRYSGSNGGPGGMNELIVVTLLVAVEGGVKLPNVSSLEELQSALNRLGSISKDQTLAVEVLWTPQDDDDYYTREEIIQDYPTLNNL